MDISQEAKDALEALISADRLFIGHAHIANYVGANPVAVVSVESGPEGGLSPVAVLVDADLFEYLTEPDEQIEFRVQESGGSGP